MEKIANLFHHLFIPKNENNFRAKALHPDFLTYYLLIALFLTFIVKQTGLSNVLGFATDITVNKLYELTNEERTKNGLSTLAYNDQLAEAAYNKAQDMFAKNYWSHYGPNGSTPWDFILGAHYRYEYAGENLAKNFLFSQGVVDTWMKSTTHRENILRNTYSEVGYAIVNGVLNGEQTTLVVQMFGKPLAGQIAANTPPSKTEPIPQTVTLQPTQPIVNQPNTLPSVLAKESRQPFGNLFHLSFNLNLVFLGFLMLALILDFYFAEKLHIIRVGGKNIAHLLFIAFIIIGITIISKGTIL